jgi:hypothetical protein
MPTHTKSPSGRTHVLTDKGLSVTLRYHEAPRFDDQVQGDLMRKFQREVNPKFTAGIIPVKVDPTIIDRGARPQSPDYLRGYLAGLEAARLNPGSILVMLDVTRERLAAAEEA